MQSFADWLLEEYRENGDMKRWPVGPVKRSTLDLCDKAAKELRFRDALSLAEWNLLLGKSIK